MRGTKETALNKDSIKKHLPLIAMCVFAAIAVAVILVGHFVLQIPLVPVAALVILEAVLCVCLDRMPVWVHGLAVVIQIAMGFFLECAALMAGMSVVYVAAVAFLYLWTREV